MHKYQTICYKLERLLHVLELKEFPLPYTRFLGLDPRLHRRIVSVLLFVPKNRRVSKACGHYH
jgi:ribulose bisphosphate carboxylase small subunit